MELPDTAFETNFYSVPIAQTWLHIFLHLYAISQYNIGHFIELGSFKGGTLSVLLPKILMGELSYTGVEIEKDNLDPRLQQFLSPNVVVIEGDDFTDEVQKQIKDRIATSSKPVLIFCDGSNKREEIKVYSPFLRKGDYICVHDFFIKEGGDINEKDIKFLKDDPTFEEVDAKFRHFDGGMPLWRKL